MVVFMFCPLQSNGSFPSKRLLECIGIDKFMIFPIHLCVSLQGNCTVCDGRDDLKEYSNIRSAMKVLIQTALMILLLYY